MSSPSFDRQSKFSPCGCVLGDSQKIGGVPFVFRVKPTKLGCPQTLLSMETTTKPKNVKGMAGSHQAKKVPSTKKEIPSPDPPPPTSLRSKFCDAGMAAHEDWRSPLLLLANSIRPIRPGKPLLAVILWMVAKSISHHRSETLGSDSIPL